MVCFTIVLYQLSQLILFESLDILIDPQLFMDPDDLLESIRVQLKEIVPIIPELFAAHLY